EHGTRAATSARLHASDSARHFYRLLFSDADLRVSPLPRASPRASGEDGWTERSSFSASRKGAKAPAGLRGVHEGGAQESRGVVRRAAKASYRRRACRRAESTCRRRQRTGVAAIHGPFRI